MQVPSVGILDTDRVRVHVQVLAGQLRNQQGSQKHLENWSFLAPNVLFWNEETDHSAAVLKVFDSSTKLRCLTCSIPWCSGDGYYLLLPNLDSLLQRVLL